MPNVPTPQQRNESITKARRDYIDPWEEYPEVNPSGSAESNV